jgi:hypothetical protein
MMERIMKQKRTRGVHTAVVLPADVLDHLRKSERGVSEEIRTRVALTLKQDAIDPVTRELCQVVADTAATIIQNFGVSWHSNPKAHAVFVTALAEHLAGYKPGPSGGVTDLLGPDDPPETIGKMLARQVTFSRSYPHLEAAQQRRSPLKARHIKAKKED